MKRSIICIFLIFFSAITSFAQGTWTRILGGQSSSYFENLCKSNDGGYFAVGNTTEWGTISENNSTSNIYLVKTDSAGVMQWQQVFGDSRIEEAKDIIQVPNGDIYILGEITNTTSLIDIFVMKLDANGNQIWFQTYGGVQKDYAGGLEDVGNDIVVAGSKNSTGNFGEGSDVWLFKINNAGTTVWDKLIGTSNKERAKGISKVHDGGFLLAGQRGDSATIDWTGYAVRTNALGDTLWTRVIDSIGVDDDDNAGFNACVELRGDSLLVLVGVSPLGSWGKICAVTIDLSGNTFHQFIGSGIAEEPEEVVATNDGGYMVFASYSNFGGRAALYKFSQWGGFLWSTRYFSMGGSSYFTYSSPGGICTTADGGFVLAGGASIFSNTSYKYRPTLMKVDYQGNSSTLTGITATIVAPSALCAGNTTTVSVPDAYDHYQWLRYNFEGKVFWIPDSDSSIITVDSSLNYKCVMWNDNGEHAISDIVQVTVSTIPDSVITISGGSPFNCPPSYFLRVKNEFGSTYTWMLNGVPFTNNYSYFSPNASGNYTVTISNACTTLTTAPLYISISVPVLDPGPDTLHLTYYNGSSVPCDPPVLSVPQQFGTTYSWYHNGNQVPGTNSSFTVNQAGYYYLVTQNTCGLVYSDTTWVVYDTIYFSPLTHTSTMSPTGCANRNLSFSVPSIPSGANYSWYFNGTFIFTGGTSNFFPGGVSNTLLDTGYVYCIVDFQCGTSTIVHQTDSVYYAEENSSRNIDVYGGGSAMTCFGTSINISVAQPAATYQWYLDTILLAGATQQQYMATVTGWYKCEITRPCGSYFSNNLYIQIGTSPPIISASTTSICASVTDTTKVRLETLQNTFFSTFQWRRNGLNITGANSTYYETKIPGTYDCKISYTCDTLISNSITVNLFNVPNDVASDYYGKICLGGTVNLYAAPGFTYQWYQRINLIDSIIPGATDSIYNSNSTGIFFVNISAGQCTLRSEYEIITAQNPPAPNYIMPVTPPVTCSSNSILLKANSRNDFSYQWMLNGQSIPGATTSEYLSTGIGNYSVSLTDSANCTTVSPNLETNNLTLTNISLNLPLNSLQCIGDTITISVLGNYQSYQWFYNNIIIPGATGNSITTDSSGYYSVSVTDTSGCGGLAGSNISYVTAPAVTAISATPATCQSSNGILNVTFTTVVDVSWTGPSFIGSTSGSVVNANNLLPGWYYFTYSYPGSNCSFTDSVEVPNLIAPQVQINAGTGVICHGEFINAGAFYATYLWSNGQTNYSIYPTTTGWYTLTVTTLSGCSGTDSVYVTVNNNPAVNIQTAGTPVICNGSPIQLDAGPGFSQYQWSNGLNTQVITVLFTGTYIVTVTDAVSGCTNKDTLVVTQDTLAVMALTPSGSVVACQGTPVIIQATTGFPSYLWSDGSTNSSINVSSTGTYVVTVSNAAGTCFGQDSVAVTINPLPVLTATAQGPTSFCVGDSVQITSVGSPGSYQWYRYSILQAGATGSSIYANTSGGYRCLVTDVNGCSAYSNTIAITTPCQYPADPIEKIADEIIYGNMLEVYPNPGSGIFEIKISENFVPLDFHVIDVSGRIVMGKSGLSEIDRNIFRFDLSFAKSGVYLLLVTDEKHVMHRVRIVKL